MTAQLQAKKILKKTVIAVAAMLACSAAQAQTTVYSFGTQISVPNSTTFQPSATFAQLAVTTTDYMHYVFDLQATSNFNALFGTPNAYIHRVEFNTNNVDPVLGSVSLVAGTWGVDHVYLSTRDQLLGGITFDFAEGWGNSSGNAVSRLTSGERVMWESAFATPTAFAAPPFALKVFGLGSDGMGGGWYVPTSPVPEPESYAMMLAGLGLLGFVARRRKAKVAKAAA